MSKPKVFNTESFNGFKDAIYEMHRLLKRVKQTFKDHDDFQESKQEVARWCANDMEAALARAGKYGQEWLAEIRKSSPG